MSLLGFTRWLAATPWSIALHESVWMYPIIESVDVLTLCCFVGMSVVSGGALFYAIPVRSYQNILFRAKWKMTFLDCVFLVRAILSSTP